MASNWMDIFALSQFAAGFAKIPYGGRTVRVIIRNFISGNKIKVALANRYGKKGISVSKISVCNSDINGVLIGEPQILKFNNEEYGIVGAKSSLSSDETDYNITPGYLAISVYFKGRATIGSVNMLREKVLVSGKGDFTEIPTIEKSNRITDKILNSMFKLFGMPRIDIIPLLESVSVYTENTKGSVLAFGDSITQGGKWSYELAERMNNPVLNLGISGNRLLKDCSFPIFRGLFGKAAVSRFDRDILTRQGAKAIIILLGTNDIGQPGTLAANKKEAAVKDIIDGLTDLANRARKFGLYTFVCTNTPFKYFRMGYIGNSMQSRQDLNNWIRNNKVFNGYFDFDAMIKDPKENERIAEPYDSGDHLHPSDAGSIKMLDAIDIDMLNRICEGK